MAAGLKRMLAVGLLVMCGPLWAAQKVDLDYHVHLLPQSDQAEVLLTLARASRSVARAQAACRLSRPRFMASRRRRARSEEREQAADD